MTGAHGGRWFICIPGSSLLRAVQGGCNVTSLSDIALPKTRGKLHLHMEENELP